jgi:UDPglucose 6-dehydrogenase
MKLTVVGLGKLGLPFAACLASRGFEVVGVDASDDVVAAVNKAKPPHFEPGLEQLLQETSGRLHATNDLERATTGSAATLILVPSPAESSGALGNEVLLSVAAELGRALKTTDDFHLVSVMSTVMPGAMQGAVIPALEAASGKRCGRDFGVCYSPELVALGSVIRDILQPGLLLVGESDARSGDLLAGIYERLCESAPTIARLSLVDAEIAKLAINAYLATKVSFGNSLARFCQTMPGADVDAVTETLGLDDRIGARYLKGAAGYGGPCLPRDNRALMLAAQISGLEMPLQTGAAQENAENIRSLVSEVLSHLPEGGTVGILGFAFKPDTHVIEEAPGLQLAETLIAEGVRVVGYDPEALPNVRDALADRIGYARDAAETVAVADVVVIATPWKEFKSIPASVFQRAEEPRAVIDCWRLLADVGLEESCRYIPLGIGPLGSWPG